MNHDQEFLTLLNWKKFILSLCIQGSLTGLITGLIITLWVGIGAQIYPPLPERTRPLNLSVAGCDVRDTNITTTVSAWTSTAFPTTEPRQEICFLQVLHPLRGTMGKSWLPFCLIQMNFIFYVNFNQQDPYFTSFAVTYTERVNSIKLVTKYTSYLSFSIVRPTLADSWYSLSYLYFCPVAVLVTMSTGLIVSAITGERLLIQTLTVRWDLDGQ